MEKRIGGGGDERRGEEVGRRKEIGGEVRRGLGEKEKEKGGEEERRRGGEGRRRGIIGEEVRRRGGREEVSGEGGRKRELEVEKRSGGEK